MTPIFFGGGSRRAARRLLRGRRRLFRGFEPLEDRALLATFAVNSLLDTVDANPGDGVAQDASGLTTLRAAIMEANALVGNDAINLPAGTYLLTLAGHDEDAAATGDLDITGSGTLTILGAGAPATIVDAAGLGPIGDRVFHVLAGANPSLSGLTVRNGRVDKAFQGPPPFPPAHRVGDGGGIFNAGTLAIVNAIVSGNAVWNFGAAIYNGEGATLTISDSTISGNQGRKDLGSGNHKGGGVYNGGTLTMIHCTVSGNSAPGADLLGGLFGQGQGGGIYNAETGIATMASSTISENRVGGSPGLAGGGIYNAGTVAITNTTIGGNSAVAPAPGSVTLGNVVGVGGGIANIFGTMTLTNTTISGNTAANGGAISNHGQLTINSSTIASNAAQPPRLLIGGVGGVVSDNGVTVLNTIIAQNSSTGIRDFSGAATSLGNNLIGHKDTSTGWTESDQLDIDPRLAALADNGGPTWTHALLPGSPAIDAGNNTAAPSTDQRGNRRPRDGDGDGVAVVDVGAFEFALGQSGIEAAPDLATLNEDTTNNIIPVLANDAGPVGTMLTVADVTQPAHGTASVGSNGDVVLYTPAPNFAGTDSFAYTVSDGSGAATAMVTVMVINTDTDLQGTADDDVFLVRLDASGANVQVFGNDTATGAPLFSMPLDAVTALLFEALGGDDRLLIDTIHGSPLPAGGIQFLGGDQGAGGDVLVVREHRASGAYRPDGEQAGDGMVTLGGSNVALAGVEAIDVSGFGAFTVATPNADDALSLTNTSDAGVQLSGTSGDVAIAPVTLADISTFIIDAESHDATSADDSGDDSLNVSTTPDAAGSLGVVQYRSGMGDNTLSIESGTARIDATVSGGGTLATTVSVGSALITRQFRQTSLALAAGSRATIIPNGIGTAPSMLNRLTLEEGATLDITDHALVIDYASDSPAAMIRDKIAEGRGGAGVGQGLWNGTGITSSEAQLLNAVEADARSIGYAENATLPLGPYTTFRGQPVDDTSMLIAYTRTGDANLDGVVDDNDVTVAGATYAPGLSQPDWALGDFDYNGFVDDDDITLLGAFYHPPASTAAPAAIQPVAGRSGDPVIRSNSVFRWPAPVASFVSATINDSAFLKARTSVFASNETWRAVRRRAIGEWCFPAAVEGAWNA